MIQYRDFETIEWNSNAMWFQVFSTPKHRPFKKNFVRERSSNSFLQAFKLLVFTYSEKTSDRKTDFVVKDAGKDGNLAGKDGKLQIICSL